MAIELVTTPTAVEEGDAVIVNRGGNPASVLLSDIGGGSAGGGGNGGGGGSLANLGAIVTEQRSNDTVVNAGDSLDITPTVFDVNDFGALLGLAAAPGSALSSSSLSVQENVFTSDGTLFGADFVYAVNVRETDENFVVTDTGGITTVDSAGTTVTRVAFTEGNAVEVIAASDTTVLLIGAQEAASSVDLQTFTAVTPPRTDGFLPTAAAHFNGAFYVFYFSRAAYRSADDGQTWEELPLIQTADGQFDLRVKSSDSDGEKLVIGADFGYVAITQDGDNWTSQQIEPNNTEAGDTVIDAGVIYSQRDTNREIYASEDGGATFSLIGTPPPFGTQPSGFPDSRSSSLAVSGGVIYANVTGFNQTFQPVGAIGYSTDGGATWQQAGGLIAGTSLIVADEAAVTALGNSEGVTIEPSDLVFKTTNGDRLNIQVRISVPLLDTQGTEEQHLVYLQRGNESTPIATTIASVQGRRFSQVTDAGLIFTYTSGPSDPYNIAGFRVIFQNDGLFPITVAAGEVRVDFFAVA